MNTIIDTVSDWVLEFLEFTEDHFEHILFFTVMFIAVVILVMLIRFVFWLFSRPRLRLERVRLFLDLLETGLTEGKTEAEALTGLEGCEDKALGLSLSAAIDAVAYGDYVSEALRKEPSALPPRAVELIAVGERLGDVRKVLPLVRRWCGDESARMAAMFQHPVVVLLGALPMYVMISLFLKVVIMPKFAEIADSMLDGASATPLTPYFYNVVAPGFDLCVVGGLVLLLVGYAVMVGLSDTIWSKRLCWCKRLVDKLAYRLPWRHNRLRRDFATVLATLLDAGVDEAEAVGLAAACTNNLEIERRAGNLVGRLASGERLTDALAVMDDKGDVAWRWTTASQGHPGFVASLRGWGEALSARADRAEQVVSHVVSSVTVVVIGVMVLNLMLTVWIPLLNIETGAWLW